MGSVGAVAAVQAAAGGGGDPGDCSSAVAAIVSLISPLPYAADLRPYYTVQVGACVRPPTSWDTLYQDAVRVPGTPCTARAPPEALLLSQPSEAGAGTPGPMLVINAQQAEL